MKRLLIILAIGSAVAISSCKDDDNAAPEGVLGEWTLNNYKEENGKFMVKDEIFSTFDRQSNTETGTISFSDDGSYTANYGYNLTTNINTAGYQKAVKTKVDAIPTNGTYTFNIEDSSLVLAGGSNAGNYRVKELTQNILVLNFDATAIDTLADSPGTMEALGTIEFSK